MQDTTIPERRFPAGKFAMGVALLGAGICSLVSDYEIGHMVRHFWPVLLIIAGIGAEIDLLQSRRNGGGGGLVLLGVGIWMFIATNRFYDLDYRTAFPIGVMVVGVGLIVHAVLGIGAKKENHHEQQH